MHTRSMTERRLRGFHVMIGIGPVLNMNTRPSATAPGRSVDYVRFSMPCELSFFTCKNVFPRRNTAVNSVTAHPRTGAFFAPT